jgi:hypothetical protein
VPRLSVATNFIELAVGVIVGAAFGGDALQWVRYVSQPRQWSRGRTLELYANP